MPNPYGMSQNSSAWWKASAANFSDAGTTPAVVDTDTVAQVNSQDGNVVALTQTTSGDRPKLVTSNANGLPAWQFKGGLTVTMGLDIPGGFATDKQNLTILVACRGIVGMNGSGNGGGLVWTGTGGPLLKTKANLIATDISGGESNPTQKSAMGENPQVIALRANASNIRWYIDGVYATSTALASGTQTGGNVGNAVDLFGLIGEIYEVMIATALSDADLALAVAGMAAANSVTVPTSQVVFGVESNVSGVAGSSPALYGQSPLAKAISAAYVPRTMKLVNVGISGQSIATAFSNISLFTDIINTTTFGLTGNLFPFTGGLNDRNGGASIATVEASIQSFGRALRNAGGIPIWVQPPPAGVGSAVSSTVRTEFDTIRTWAAANWPSFANAYVPLPAALADPTNTTYWQSDQLHFTPAGQALWAAAISPVLSNVVAGVGVAAVTQRICI